MEPESTVKDIGVILDTDQLIISVTLLKHFYKVETGKAVCTLQILLFSSSFLHRLDLPILTVHIHN